jgi:hypothetical protein
LDLFESSSFSVLLFYQGKTRDVMLGASKVYGEHPAVRRGVVMSQAGPPFLEETMETSYQNAYYPQQGEPRACSTTQIERPKVCRAPMSTVGAVIEQSRTSMSDCASIAQSSFRPPAQNKQVRIASINDPKQQATMYPSLVSGGRGNKFSK